uniref:Uncharacterized protein n=1 Tax=Leersia perrieri TaxID=77586 RepID=A0A0D9XW82_9ORYZ
MATPSSAEITESRHVGHEECAASHVSTQRTWKPWWHLGNTRTLSPAAKSPRQMAHSSSATPASLVPYTSTGILLSSFLFSPAVADGVAVAAAGERLRAQWRAQRMRELRPRAQMRKQSSAARMITMLASKPEFPDCCRDEEAIAPAPVVAAHAGVVTSAGAASTATSRSRRMALGSL